MDKITPEQRSYTMSRIRSKDTKPEMLVRRHLHALGFRYSLHSSKLPGHPDLVLTKWHTVIFVNGCFWHRHEGCKAASTPKSNVEFWQAKFQRNVERDKHEHALLKAAGWRVIVIWECEVKSRINELQSEITENNNGRSSQKPRPTQARRQRVASGDNGKSEGHARDSRGKCRQGAKRSRPR
jgi:DNA mismatch endonuclease (patch repair protein)